MKKIALVLAALLVLSLPLSIQAAEPRMISVFPHIDVNDTTVTYSVNAAGNNMSEYLEATIKLYRNNIWIGTWTVEGYGYIHFTKDTAAVTGSTYQMAVDLKVDGVAIPRATAST